MKKLRGIYFYIIIISVFIGLMYCLLQLGENLQLTNGRVILKQVETSHWAEFLKTLFLNLSHPLAILLGQILTIVIVSKIFGWICSKIGQPTVIGEIIAGIALGPSFLGYYFPQISSAIFPLESLGNLEFLSQIGLILFMYIVGMDLDLKVIKNKVYDAVIISHVGIVVPFAFGIGVAYCLYSSFAPQGVPFLSFGLFIGVAMSIAAFPVLARIIHERGIHKTRLGSFVIACAAVDDITAWSLLAAVIAIVKAGSVLSSLYVISLAIIYVIVMIKIVRPFIKRVGDLYPTRENMSKPIVAIFFLTLIISSYATEVIGIHALFGAFMAGTIMPDNVKVRNVLIEKVEDIALILFLPLFFVFTGLRTEIGLLNDPYMWKLTGFIIFVAVLGKFSGTALSAKFVGQSWRNSLSIGALMNTRGLMELVVLNIGYDLGVLSPEIFAMMVIMALVTTVMTGPALDLINIRKKKKLLSLSLNNENKEYNILVSFGMPEKSKSLLRIANGFARKMNNNSSITVMNLAPNNDLSHINIDEYEKNTFAPIHKESKLLNQKITTIFKVSSDISTDISETANIGRYDLLIIGFGLSIYEGSFLGRVLGFFSTRIINPDRFINKVTGKEKFFEKESFEENTRLIIEKTKIPIGIFLDKDLSEIKTVILPIYDKKDFFLINYASKLSYNLDAQVTVWIASLDITKTDINNYIKSIEKNSNFSVNFYEELEINKEFLHEHNIMLISLEGWKKNIDSSSLWLSGIPSTLILSESKVLN